MTQLESPQDATDYSIHKVGMKWHGSQFLDN